MPAGIYTGTVSAATSKAGSSGPVTMRIGSTESVIASPNQINLRLAQDGASITAPFLSPVILSKIGLDRVPAESAIASGKWISATVFAGSVVVKVDPAGLSRGVYNDGRVAMGCALADCPIEVPVHLEIVPPGPPQIANPGVGNNATFSPYEPGAPGDVMVIRGEQLSNTAPSCADGTPLPMSLGGVSVTVDGVGAPLYYTSSGQVCFQTPYSMTGTAQVQLFRDGLPGNSASIHVVPHGPQIVAITAADYSLRDATVTPLPMISVGSDWLQPSFAGLAPGLVGLYRIHFTLPTNVPQGTVLVTLGFRGDSLSDSVPLAIR